MNPDDQSVDKRPWEQLGAVRRDSEPHRGRLLLALSLFPLCLYAVWHTLSCGRMGFGSALPVGAAAIAVFDLTLNLAGTTVGAWVYALTRRDLRQMAGGKMDPRGGSQTLRAQMCAWLGMVLGVAQVFGCVVIPFWRARR